MSARTRIAGIVAGALSFALLAAACSNGDDVTPGDGAGPAGTVVISGSSTVEPVSSLVAELFREQNQDVDITVDGPGTGDGFELFCAGETDISDASRPIEAEERKACKQAGVDFVELEVALDGITVMTSPANEAVSCLALGDLYALLGPESGGFATWSDANALASDVGGTGGFPDVPLEVTGPGEESGTYDAMIELSGIEDTAIERGVPEAEAAAIRADYQSSPNDNVIIQGIQGSDSSLGWVGFAYAQNAGEGVRELEVDGGEGCVAPTFETIADGSYPLSRSLFIYVNTAKAAENPALRAYVDYYLSDEGILAVSEAGYVDLPVDRLEAARSAWSGI